MLVIMLQKDSALPINTTIWAKDQAVGGMVGIGSSEALKDNEAFVRLVVSVRISEEEQVRSRRDQNATIPKLETKGVVYFGEFDHSVGFAVAILVR